MPDTEEGVHHGQFLRFSAVEEDAFARQFDRKSGRMRTVLGAGSDRFVGDVLVVAPAAFVFAFGVGPSGYVAFISVGNANGEAVNEDLA